MLAQGFGLVEIGSVTPRPQEGNPRPRLFRLPQDRGVINRMGFPGTGAGGRPCPAGRRPRRGFVGVNIGANKDSTDRAADYVTGCVALAPYADYLVCNVSSPNTPGLRNLQGRTELAGLLKRVQDAIAAKPVPLVVKIAPDATDDDLDDIVFVCRDLRLDGIIIGNTTLSRPPSLRSERRGETGGLSGAPLTALSTEVLRKTARRVERQFPLIGCGGVGSGPTPMPRSAPAPRSCSCTRRWSMKGRRSSAESRTNWQPCWPATASLRSRMPSVRTLGPRFVASRKSKPQTRGG